MNTPVPFNDTSRIFEAHKEELQDILIRTAKSGRWLLSEETTRFADSFSRYCGVEYCLPVANGTDALEIALRSILQDPRPEDEVITVANAGGYSTSACHSIGVTPVFADIEKHNHLIDIDSLIRCLNPSVKVIVITHLYGAAVNIPEIQKKLSRANYQHIPIIEDCAQAHGAKVDDRRVGSMGDLATFSFYPTKNLGAMGDAGAITTSDPERYHQLQQLHQYGWNKKYHVAIPYGKNSRMDEIQAGVLNYLLPHLDHFNKKRTDILDRYKQFSGNNISFMDYSDRDHVGHLAVASVNNRNEFISFMKSKNIAVDIHYPIPDCDQTGWQNFKCLWDKETNLLNTREAVKNIITIPCFPFLKEDEIERICETLTEWESK